MDEDDAVCRHLRRMRLDGRTVATIDARGWLLSRLGDALGVPLAEASAAGLMAWRESLAVDRDTVRTYVSHVKQFYLWLRREGIRADDPAADLPVPPRRRRHPRPISEAHLLEALAQAPPRIRPWLALAADAGLRCKEIAGLRRENVWEHHQPPGLLIAAETTKGERRERYIVMTPFVRETLLEHGLPARGWLFRRHDGQPGPVRADLVSHLSNRYLREIGLAETMHQLRHRFGTIAQQLSGDVLITKELMGHEYTDSTAGYVLITSAQTAAVIAGMPDLRSGLREVISRGA